MKKIVIIAAAAAVLGALWGVRFDVVNKNVDAPIIQTFPKGQEVPVGKDFFNYADEEMDGYAVTVLDAQLYSAEDFLQKYHAANQANLLGIHTDYIYTVRVRVANINNGHKEEKGIALEQYVLQGTDYILSLEDACFSIANPNMPGTSFSLKQGTNMEMTLTFDVMSKITNIKHLTDDPPKLLITQYPHQKMIDASLNRIVTAI